LLIVVNALPFSGLGAAKPALRFDADVSAAGLLQRLVGRSFTRYPRHMQTFTAVIERDEATGLFVGFVPGWPGAHSQGATLDELRQNLEEVVAMLLEDGAPKLEGEFVGTQTVKVA
jgi:predicted RNase H-like HicB family nuclease